MTQQMHLRNFDNKDLAISTTNIYPFFSLVPKWCNTNPLKVPNLWVSLLECTCFGFLPHIPNIPQVTTLIPYSNKPISPLMIFIISTMSTVLFMFLLSTYQTSRLQYIVKKKWNQRNLNYNCGHPSYIVIIENKSSKLYCINISKLSNSKEKIFSSLHNWSFLLHCAPIFWNHPPKHHAKPTITKGHQELQNKNLTHLPPWHYSHKRNTTSFPLR